jgi:hypothetical protein
LIEAIKKDFLYRQIRTQDMLPTKIRRFLTLTNYKARPDINNQPGRPNSSFTSTVPPACYQMSADKIARELWRTDQEVSSVDIIPPRFSMLMYHLGDEQ